MSKIRRISYYFRIFFQFLFVVLPIIQIIGWINAPAPIRFFNESIRFDVIPKSYQVLHVLGTFEKFNGFLLSMVPVGIELLTLYFLIKLFRLYEKGEIFSIGNVRYIKKIAYTLLVGQLVNPLYEGLMGLVLTWHNPPGHRFASITLSQANVGVILTAFLIILVAWIMAEGCRLREEQQLTI